jgi:hypothetical protein
MPVIIPVVLHHSPKGWTAEVSFEALLDIDPELFETIAPYVPRFRFILDDISATSDEALRVRAISARMLTDVIGSDPANGEGRAGGDHLHRSEL